MLEFAAAAAPEASPAPFSPPAAIPTRVIPDQAAQSLSVHIKHDAAQLISQVQPSFSVTSVAAPIAGPIENATYLGSTAGQIIGAPVWHCGPAPHPERPTLNPLYGIASAVGSALFIERVPACVLRRCWYSAHCSVRTRALGRLREAVRVFLTARGNFCER